MIFQFKYLLIFALSLSLGHELFPQRRPELEGLDRWCMVPRLGYSDQGSNFLAPGFGLTYVQAKKYFPIVTGGTFACLDLSMGESARVYAPKIGLEGTFVFLTGKMTAAWYTKDSEKDVRLTPEIGLTFFGYLTCCYGYNYKLKSESSDLVSKHKITVGLNWFIDPWK